MINQIRKKSVLGLLYRCVCGINERVIKMAWFCAMMSLSLFLMSPAQASTAQMNQTMVRMINQIDALFPLVTQASDEQDKTARVQFHFDAWRDANGARHDGFRQSLLKVRLALVNQINQSNLTPKTIAPINGDYVGR
jgi:hypothetical protein